MNKKYKFVKKSKWNEISSIMISMFILLGATKFAVWGFEIENRVSIVLINIFVIIFFIILVLYKRAKVNEDLITQQIEVCEEFLERTSSNGNVRINLDEIQKIRSSRNTKGEIFQIEIKTVDSTHSIYGFENMEMMMDEIKEYCISDIEVDEVSFLIFKKHPIITLLLALFFLGIIYGLIYLGKSSQMGLMLSILIVSVMGLILGLKIIKRKGSSPTLNKDSVWIYKNMGPIITALSILSIVMSGLEFALLLLFKWIDRLSSINIG